MPIAPGTHFRCVKKAAVREGFELESERLGFLEPGEEIEVMESRANERNQMRVRYDGGWTSIESAAGSVLLVNMQPADPTALSQWATAGLAATASAVSNHELERDEELDPEAEFENPANLAFMVEMELGSRLLAEGDYQAASQCFGAMVYRDPNNDSAARGLRQAEKGVQFILREELQEWLESIGLSEYAFPLFDLGFDDVAVLQSLRPKELSRLCKSIGVGGGHTRKLCAAVLAVQRAAEAAAASGGAAPQVPGSLPSGAGGSPTAGARLDDLRTLSIGDWLAAIQLTDVLSRPLMDLGVAVAADLEILEEADITALKKQLKKVQAIKFQTKLSDVLSKLRQQEAAAEGGDYDRYWQ